MPLRLIPCIAFARFVARLCYFRAQPVSVITQLQLDKSLNFYNVESQVSEGWSHKIVTAEKSPWNKWKFLLQVVTLGRWQCSACRQMHVNENRQVSYINYCFDFLPQFVNIRFWCVHSVWFFALLMYWPYTFWSMLQLLFKKTLSVPCSKIMTCPINK